MSIQVMETRALQSSPELQMAKIRIENVDKVYKGKKEPFRALDDVSFTVGSNEFVSLLGPSGCGKSTLLRIVAGLEDATKGAVVVSDRQVKGPGVDRGMVFQTYTLFPWLTVRDNIEFGLKLKGVSRRERRDVSSRFLDLISLNKFADAYPKQLSGGMKQRVAIARALANGPEVLLMDEPFGALDAQTKVEMQEILLKIWDTEKTTVIFVTHDVEEAIYLSQRILVMKANPGRIDTEIQVHKTGYDKAEFRHSEEMNRMKAKIITILRHAK